MVQVVKKGKEFDIFYDELARVDPRTRLTGSKNNTTVESPVKKIEQTNFAHKTCLCKLISEPFQWNLTSFQKPKL